MVDTYTQSLKARRMEEDAYPEEWAVRLNADVVDIFDAGISGQVEIDIGSATTYTLGALQNGTLSETHYWRLNFVGTPASAVTITVPASVGPNKEYLIDNQTGQALTIKYAATSGVAVKNGDVARVLCDGTSVDYASSLLGPFVDVRRFGAVGDGVKDDTDALEAAHAAAGVYPVFYPPGVYLTSRPIYGSATSMHIIAHDATIQKTTNTAGSTVGTRTFNGATDDYNVDCVLALVHANGAFGRIVIEGRLQLRSSATNPVAFGLYIPRFFYSSIRNVSTIDCAIGVRGMTGILSTFENVQCFGSSTTLSTHGIQIEDFVVPNNHSTSLNFNACWGADTNRAYQIAASYSTMVNCAADRCGTEIYRLDSGAMTLIGCGSEGSLHAPVFYFNGGRHRAIQCKIIQPHSGTVASGLVFASSPAVVDGEFICDNFVDAGSALRYEVNSGATLRVSQGNAWPTNGNSPSLAGTYREFWTYAAAAPVSGTHARGERVYNTTPSVDGNNMVLDHWICTVAGNPGTWVAQYLSTVSPAT